MKKIIIFILLFTTTLLRAQNNVLVIYVDASSEKKLKEIQKQVNALVDSKSSYAIYLFISSAESTKDGIFPIVTNNRNEVDKNLQSLLLNFISAPDYNKDVKLLNAAFLENKYISDLNKISKTNGLNTQFEIHCFFDEQDYSTFKLSKKFVLPLLLSNRLKFKDGLQNNCTVMLHLINENEIKKIPYL